MLETSVLFSLNGGNLTLINLSDNKLQHLKAKVVCVLPEIESSAFVAFLCCFFCQKYLTTLRKEKEAFEMLIKEKGVSYSYFCCLFCNLFMFQSVTWTQTWLVSLEWR